MNSPSPQPARAPVSDSLRGVLWMLGAVAVLALMDAVAKAMAAEMPTLQMTWARFTGPMVILAVLLNRRLGDHLRSSRPFTQAGRAMLLLGANLFFYAALERLPLADIAAVTAIGPVLVTVLAVVLLGETVGLRRWIGVLAGFAGALVVVRPGMEDLGAMGADAIYPLGAALSFAFYQVWTRRLRALDTPVTALLYPAVIGALITSALVPAVWVWPDAVGWIQIAAVGGLATLGHFAMIRALMAAQAAVVAPFNYTNLPWAIVFGLVFFGHFPDAATLIGAAIVAASGIYILRRERLRAAPAAEGAAGARPD